MEHFLASFKVTGLAVLQIFILGALGYYLVKKDILPQEGLKSLSRLVIEIIFPALIFSRLVKDFSFDTYSDWWFFPLISLLITASGFIIGSLFVGFVKGPKHKTQFLSLSTFQNSGYMPLAMVAALLPKDQAGSVFIYIFLFLLGFDLVMWSVGVYMLTSTFTKKFELGSIFSPPVIANLVSLFLVAIGLNKLIPDFIMTPARMVGDCTLPLAMLIVGGNIACIKLGGVDKKAIFLSLLAKLIILPSLGLLVILKLNLPYLLVLLILMQLAMPPATSLSVVVRHYKKEDLLISQGVFFGHLVSIITIPVFLSLYFVLTMSK